MASMIGESPEYACAKEVRQIESAIQQSRRLNEIADETIGRLADMRNRLIGAPNEAQSIDKAKAELRPIHSECHDLQERLDALDKGLKAIVGLVSELERV